jgi:hypothetical protein
MGVLVLLLLLFGLLQAGIDAFAGLSMGSAVEQGAVIAVAGATGELSCDVILHHMKPAACCFMCDYSID